MRIRVRATAAIPGVAPDVASIMGEVVTHNGRTFDLSSIGEGDVANPEGGDHPFRGPITRKDGILHVGLRMAFDASTAEPDQPADPAHWTIDIEAGDVPDLVIRNPAAVKRAASAAAAQEEVSP